MSKSISFNKMSTLSQFKLDGYNEEQLSIILEGKIKKDFKSKQELIKYIEWTGPLKLKIKLLEEKIDMLNEKNDDYICEILERLMKLEDK